MIRLTEATDMRFEYQLFKLAERFGITKDWILACATIDLLNRVRMSASTAISSWSEDLKRARNVPDSQKQGYDFLLSWFEKWRVAKRLPPGREAARAFWRHRVKSKPRDAWQLEQWTAAFGWYFEWLRFTERHGGEVRTLEERVFQAVDRAGGRRGLALRTRQTYGRWAARYAAWAGSAKAVQSQERARAFLGRLVTVERQSFGSQKQALNALTRAAREAGIEKRFVTSRHHDL